MHDGCSACGLSPGEDVCMMGAVHVGCLWVRTCA